MKITWEKILEEGELIPWGYGFAYANPEYGDRTYYPIPLNLLVIFWRKIVWKLRRPKWAEPSELEKRLAYQSRRVISLEMQEHDLRRKIAHLETENNTLLILLGKELKQEKP